MPECPFCGEYLMDQDKLNTHIFTEHPDKVSTPDSVARAMAAASEGQNVRYLAALLTESSLRSGKSAKEVLELHGEVLLRLRSSLRIIKGITREDGNEKPDGPNPG